ncbi:hypothetical protein DPMN_122148 [Dreissena polymorpha]|uniref:Uncharacterized protein n=1 Tax=Dreissena polymorpha TaxID=45954 RepID=A0A9D4JU74_DREPO|nr:hypothetical protein DPMN_122148 [Dreissena polymorpha]
MWIWPPLQGSLPVSHYFSIDREQTIAFLLNTTKDIDNDPFLAMTAGLAETCMGFFLRGIISKRDIPTRQFNSTTPEKHAM